MVGKLGAHSGWSIAVGGMIGGGVYTIAGLVIEAAGPLAWIGLAVGAVIALLTAASYRHLTVQRGHEGVPLTVLASAGHHDLARMLAWWLLLAYVFALAVYTFTAGHYLGAAFGVPSWGVIAIEVAILSSVVLLNVVGASSPVIAQVASVWLSLAILVGLVVVGLVRWSSDHVTRGMPDASLVGVARAAAVSFMAYEGFEMLAYDVGELERPGWQFKRSLPFAIVVVGVLYALVTLASASLAGADEVVRAKDHSLAVAGRAAAGTAGLVLVTVAACAASISAINATLFSAARLARSTAERGLLSHWFARANRRGVPGRAVLVIGALSALLAAVVPLQPLVASSSFAFLCLFALVNVLAIRRRARWAVVSVLGAIGAIGGAVVVGVELARKHPIPFAVVIGALIVMLLRHGPKKNG